jgi:proton-dependent oligopeptide transporter, POT family
LIGLAASDFNAYQAAEAKNSATEADADAGTELADYPTPTQEERRTLRKVSDHIPLTAYILCTVELAERASYYGVINLFNNFIQFPLPKGGPGTGAIDPSRPNDSAGAL